MINNSFEENFLKKSDSESQYDPLILSSPFILFSQSLSDDINEYIPQDSLIPISKEKQNINSTNSSSDKKNENESKIKLVFSCEKKPNSNYEKSCKDLDIPSYFRLDMAKKYFKTKISRFATDKLNQLIQESDLPLNIKKTIHLPNSKLFTSKVTESINFDSLNYSVKKIFTIGKETQVLQKKNYVNISKIYEYIKSKIWEIPDNIQKIPEFLEMSYEELIKMFYDSNEFLEIKNEDKAKFYEKGTKNQEGFGLLEDYGLIKLFKLLKKKRNRD